MAVSVASTTSSTTTSTAAESYCTAPTPATAARIRISPFVSGFPLTLQQRGDLKAFLESLTDEDSSTIPIREPLAIEVSFASTQGACSGERCPSAKRHQLPVS